MALSAPDEVHGGVDVAPIGFGCWSLMRLPSARRRRDLLAAALDAGLTHFDTARMYGLGAAEGELGRALRGRRDDVTIATKFGIDVSGALRRLGRLQAPARAVLARSSATQAAARRRRGSFAGARRYDAESARRSLDVSLRDLGVDHVDILFLHDPRPQDEIDAGALVEFLEAARAAGKIRAWGVSLDEPSGLAVLPRLAEPDFVQLRQDALDPPVPRPRSIAFGVLAAHAAITAWLRTEPAAHARWREALALDPLSGDALAALLLGHALRQPETSSILYSTTRVDRLAAAGELMRGGPEPERLDTLAALLTRDRAAIIEHRDGQRAGHRAGLGDGHRAGLGDGHRAGLGDGRPDVPRGEAA